MAGLAFLIWLAHWDGKVLRPGRAQ